MHRPPSRQQVELLRLKGGGGRYVKDRPHMMVSFKIEEMIKNHTHITLHGYTTDLRSSGLMEVTAQGGAKPDVNEYGVVYPQNDDVFEFETIAADSTILQQLPPPNQNQSFLTFPTPVHIHGATHGMGKNECKE